MDIQTNVLRTVTEAIGRIRKGKGLWDDTQLDSFRPPPTQPELSYLVAAQPGFICRVSEHCFYATRHERTVQSHIRKTHHDPSYKNASVGYRGCDVQSLRNGKKGCFAVDAHPEGNTDPRVVAFKAARMKVNAQRDMFPDTRIDPEDAGSFRKFADEAGWPRRLVCLSDKTTADLVASLDLEPYPGLLAAVRQYFSTVTEETLRTLPLIMRRELVSWKSGR